MKKDDKIIIICYHRNLLLLLWVCRPLRLSRHTSNSPAFPVGSSCFPIRPSIQCLRGISYHIFSPQSESPQWYFTNQVPVYEHLYDMALALHSMSSPLKSSVSDCT